MHKDALGKLRDANDLRKEAKRLENINPTASRKLLAGAVRKEASAARQLTRVPKPRGDRQGTNLTSGLDAVKIPLDRPLV